MFLRNRNRVGDSINKMTKEEKKKHCSGCRDDFYNHGGGGADECWMLEKAELKLRKKVSSDMPPPWEHSPKQYLSCYGQKGYVFFDGDRVNWSTIRKEEGDGLVSRQ